MIDRVTTYLNEVWLANPSAASFKKFVDAFGKLKDDPAALGLPADFRLIAGPWFSSEEAKALFVFEIDDINVTFPVFTRLVAAGLLARRRVTPIVPWSAAEELAREL